MGKGGGDHIDRLTYHAFLGRLGNGVADLSGGVVQIFWDAQKEGHVTWEK